MKTINNDEKGLIVCHPDMKDEIIRRSAGSQLPPEETWVLTKLLPRDVGIVISAREFTDFLTAEQNHAWHLEEEK